MDGSFAGPAVARRRLVMGLATLAVIVVAAGVVLMQNRDPGPAESAEPLSAGPVRALPSPDAAGGLPLNTVLAARRSVRSFAATPLDEREVGQLLWAAQGLSGPGGGRTAPSAGALYPLEVIVVDAGGSARYLPAEHALAPIPQVLDRGALVAAALGQEAVAEAPVVLVITGVPERTAQRYGGRAMRYVWLEAGHAAQNVLLEAVSLGLAAVPIGAFDDGRLASALGLPDGELPLYLVPVGHPR